MQIGRSSWVKWSIRKWRHCRKQKEVQQTISNRCTTKGTVREGRPQNLVNKVREVTRVSMSKTVKEITKPWQHNGWEESMPPEGNCHWICQGNATQPKNKNRSENSESDVQGRCARERLECWDELETSHEKDKAKTCAAVATKVQSITVFATHKQSSKAWIRNHKCVKRPSGRVKCNIVKHIPTQKFEDTEWAKRVRKCTQQEFDTEWAGLRFENAAECHQQLWSRNGCHEMLSWQTRRVCSACSVGRKRWKHGAKRKVEAVGNDWTHEWWSFCTQRTSRLKHNKEFDQRMLRRQIDDFETASLRKLPQLDARATDDVGW